MFTIPTEETANSPWPIFNRLLETHEELNTLREGLRSGWTLSIMFRYGEWNRNGRGILGTCQMPGVNGSLSKLFDWLLEEQLGYSPTFLILLNGEWWHEAGDRRREILLFHEALHAGQRLDKYGSPMYSQSTGEPIPAIVGHDLEEFNAVVERYGAWKTDITAFVQAFKRHRPDGEVRPAPAPVVYAGEPEPPEEAMF